MTLQMLEYFIALVEKGSFTDAANACYVSQPALSRAIANLEKELGCAVVERGKTVVATAAGEVLRIEAERILGQIDVMVERVQRAKQGYRGTMVLGYVAYGMLRAFRQNFKSGLLVSILLVPLYLGQYLLFGSALGAYLAQGTGLPTLVLFAVGFLGINCFAMYLLPLLAFLKADGLTVLRNAFLLCFAEGGWSLTGSITAMVIFSLGAVSLPHSLPLFILIFFSLLVYHWCFFGWKILDKYVFTPYYEQHPEQRDADNFT